MHTSTNAYEWVDALPALGSPAGASDAPTSATPPRSTRVADVMTANPITLRESDSVTEGGLRLLRAGISGAPVVNAEGALVGVFSHSDMLAKFATPRLRRGPLARDDERHALAQTVGVACSRPPAISSPDAALATAARELLDRDIGRLIVVDHGRVVGIISRSDVLKELLRHAGKPALTGSVISG